MEAHKQFRAPAFLFPVDETLVSLNRRLGGHKRC